MANRLDGLPNEILLHIAGYLRLDMNTRVAFAKVCRTLRAAGNTSLHDDPLLVARNCLHPNRQPRVPCDATMLNYLRHALRQGHFPLSLIVVKDDIYNEKRAHTLPLDLLTHNDPVLHADFATLRQRVQTALPQRPQGPPAGPPADWLTQLEQSNFYVTVATCLVCSGNLQEITVISTRPDAFDGLPIHLITQDIAANASNPTAQLPLRKLRTLSISGEIVGWGPQFMYYPADISMLPSLRNLCYGFEVPFLSAQHTNLHQFRLNKFACRNVHPTAGDLDLTQPIPVGHPHEACHILVRQALRRMPNLRHLAISESRLCNPLIGGYAFLEQDFNGAQMHKTRSSLAHIVQHSMRGLESFMMRSYILPAGHNGGLWLFRHFRSSMGPWHAYPSLKSLSIEAWFFFPGPAPPSPVKSQHPDVKKSDLPRSIEWVEIHNLVDDYLNQFYYWLTYVWSEKAQGKLPNLTTIVFSTLNFGEDFPDPDRDLEYADLEGCLAKAHVQLIRQPSVQGP